MKEADPTIGIGVASGWRHITGGVGPAEECGAGLGLLDNGHVYVNCGCAQMGNETLVGLAQIAAKELGMRFEDMEINYDLQTDNTPWGQGVMASRAASHVGHGGTGGLQELCPASDSGGKTPDLLRLRVPQRQAL